VDAAYCIDRTAKAAINRGFTTRVIKDAVISSTPKQLSKALNAHPLAGIQLILASQWQSMI
jgi:nicotinamidase-related amidase